MPRTYAPRTTARKWQTCNRERFLTTYRLNAAALVMSEDDLQAAVAQAEAVVAMRQA